MKKPWARHHAASIESLKISQNGIYMGLVTLGSALILCAVFVEPIGTILEGWKHIVLSPNVLFTDAFAVGGVGAALWNAGVMCILAVALLLISGTEASAAVVAATTTVCGFSFFGKNPLNTIPVLLGGILYLRLGTHEKNHAFVSVLYVTGLGPLTSTVLFNRSFQLGISLPLSIGVGLLAGYVLLPISQKVMRLHKGYSLYNIGFAAGWTATLFVIPMRAIGVRFPTDQALYVGGGDAFVIGLTLVFSLLVAVGFILNGYSLRNYCKLLKEDGRAGSDFLKVYGLGLCLVNSGLLALSGLLLVTTVGAPVNGPVIGALFTIAGFALYGKQPRNVIPLVLGAAIASLIGFGSLTQTEVIAVVLFSSALAPVAGRYGSTVGVFAGMVHVFVAHHVGILHAGVNLYNNGFAAGFVAFLVVNLMERVVLRSRHYTPDASG